jgi:hypothetical protein
MSLFDYTTTNPPVHLPGTPHVRGAKGAIGEIRNGLRHLADVLCNSGWVDDHPIGGDQTALDVIEFVEQLGPAQRHALRIAAAVLVRITPTR